MLCNDLLFASLEYLPYKEAVKVLMAYDITLVEKLPLRNFKIECHNPNHALYHIVTRKEQKKIRNVQWSHLPDENEMKQYQDIEELSFSHSFDHPFPNGFIFPSLIRKMSFGHQFEWLHLTTNIQWPEQLTHLSFADHLQLFDNFIDVVRTANSSIHIRSLCYYHISHTNPNFDQAISYIQHQANTSEVRVKLPDTVTHLKMPLHILALWYIDFPSQLQVLYVTDQSHTIKLESLQYALSLHPFFAASFFCTKASTGFILHRKKLEPGQGDEVCKLCNAPMNEVVVFPCRHQHRIHSSCFQKWLDKNKLKPVQCAICSKSKK